MPGIQKEYKDHQLEEEQNLCFLVRCHIESCDSSEAESKSGEIGRGSCFSVLGSESKNEIECEGEEIGHGSCFFILEIKARMRSSARVTRLVAAPASLPLRLITATRLVSAPASPASAADCASFHNDNDDNTSNMSDDVKLID